MRELKHEGLLSIMKYVTVESTSGKMRGYFCHARDSLVSRQLARFSIFQTGSLIG